jgi:hypothetical protein
LVGSYERRMLAEIGAEGGTSWPDAIRPESQPSRHAALRAAFAAVCRAGVAADLLSP